MSTGRLRIRSPWEELPAVSFMLSKESAGGCPDPWRGPHSHHQQLLIPQHTTDRSVAGCAAARGRRVSYRDANRGFGGSDAPTSSSTRAFKGWCASANRESKAA